MSEASEVSGNGSDCNVSERTALQPVVARERIFTAERIASIFKPGDSPQPTAQPTALGGVGGRPEWAATSSGTRPQRNHGRKVFDRWEYDGPASSVVYIVKALDIDPPVWKVGQSDDPIGRLDALQTGSPIHLELVGLILGENEKALHRKLRSSRSHGEWFYWSRELQELIDRSREFAAIRVRQKLKRPNEDGDSYEYRCVGLPFRIYA